MLRSLLFILIITLLSGCSEMQVIGKAALRELRADGMSVEVISYNYHQKLAAREQATGITLARADMSSITTDGSMVGSAAKLTKIAKTNRAVKSARVKGLWEKH